MEGKKLIKQRSGVAIDWLKNLPNKLTLSRLGVVPILILLYSLDFNALDYICAFVFLAAALTDFFDGFLARRYQLESELGALLDPVADKILVASCFILLASRGVAPAWMIVLLISRELFISGLRLVAAQRGIEISVNQFGKLKTVAQSTAIFCLFINQPFLDLPMRAIGMIALWVALGLAVYSAYHYWQFFWNQCKDELA